MGRMVVMRVVVMRMVVVIVAMIVAIPAQMRARHLQQAQLRGLGPHRTSGALQPGGQIRSRPDQQARILQPARIRGAHLVMMRAGPLRQQNLHLRKIDLADRVLVVNPGGYVGESTRREIAYARATGTPVSFTDPA